MQVQDHVKHLTTGPLPSLCNSQVAVELVLLEVFDWQILPHNHPGGQWNDWESEKWAYQVLHKARLQSLQAFDWQILPHNHPGGQLLQGQAAKLRLFRDHF